MSKRYANPPVVEAICEFQVTPETEWDATIPGLVYKAVEDEFPGKRQTIISRVEETREAETLRQEVRVLPRAVFLAADGKSSIQVGDHVLAVNCLKPYSGWQGFEPKIRKGLDVLRQTVEVVGFRRIGLRYVNRIEIHGEFVDLDAYFDLAPHLGDKLPQTMVSFMVGCVLPFEDTKDSCRLQLASAVPETPGAQAYRLDLDYATTPSETVATDRALAWVETAHRRIEDLFEGCIREPLRELFGEVH